MLLLVVISLFVSKSSCNACNKSGSCDGCKNNKPRGCGECSVRDGFAGVWVGKNNKPAGTCPVCQGTN